MQVQPQWLFLSSWNEMIAQPQAAYGQAMGLSADSSLGNSGFVGELCMLQCSVAGGSC